MDVVRKILCFKSSPSVMNEVYCYMHTSAWKSWVRNLLLFLAMYAPAVGTVQEYSLQEVTEGGVIYDIPNDPVTAKVFDPETGVNIAYGVLQGVPTTPNPAYGQVQR